MGLLTTDEKYARTLDVLRAEWPKLFSGYRGLPKSAGEVRFVSERLGFAVIPEPRELLKAALVYLGEEKEPEPAKPAVKSTPQVTKGDLPASSGAGSW